MAQLTVDDGYKNIQVWVDGQCIATEDIIDSVRISYGCTDGNSPAVGATFSPHCEVTINSNDGIDSLSQYLRLGKFFTILCELHEGTYTNMGAFHIIQPPMYTEDYDVTFSGEGLLGSVFDKTYVDYTLMQQYSDKGVITVTQALQIVEDMYQGLSIETPNESELPTNFYAEARIVVPLKSTKWDKDVAYESRFIKITVREWLAGIAIMMGGNVIEYGNTFSIRSLNQPMTDDYFTEDDFVSDWRKEMQIYAPKSMYLRTYETTPVKKNNVVKGYCIKTECDCNSVYNPDLSGLNDAHKYDLFVDCQWIGRSFESYYFSGSIDGESGEYDKSTPRRTYPVFNTPIQYTPSEWEFSGWNDAFIPGNTFVAKCTVKNTETQQEEERNTKVFLMDMDWNWNGTITVGSSSSYGGDAERAELAIDDKDDSIAWNDRVVKPYEEPPIPIPTGNWHKLGFITTSPGWNFVWNGEFRRLGFSVFAYLQEFDSSTKRMKNITNYGDPQDYGYENPDSWWRGCILYNNRLYSILGKDVIVSGRYYRVLCLVPMDNMSYYIQFPDYTYSYNVYDIIVYHDTIHFIGRAGGYQSGNGVHLTSRGGSIIVQPRIPFELDGNPKCAIYNDCIYVTSRTKMYKYNGEWSYVCDMPEAPYSSGYMPTWHIVNYHDMLHVFLTQNSKVRHYVWDDSSWHFIDESPFYSFGNYYDESFVVYDDAIYYGLCAQYQEDNDNWNFHYWKEE